MAPTIPSTEPIDAPSSAGDRHEVPVATPGWARFVLATTAVAALGSVLWAVVSQWLLDSRNDAGPPTAATLADSAPRDSANRTVEAPPAEPAEPFRILPKPPSTNHLLAHDSAFARNVSLPSVEVVAPEPVKPKPDDPPLDPRQMAAVAELTARLTDLEKQRTELVRNRSDALGEKARLERIIEQGVKDIPKSEEKVVEYELAITSLDLQLASLRQLSGSNSGVRSPRQGSLDLTNLTQQRTQLVLDQSALRTEITKIRLRNETSLKQLQALNPRLEQLAKQGEYFRKQWLRETCDWFGRRTRAEQQAAAAFFTDAIEADRSNFGAWLARAACYVHLNRSADALADLVTADDPSNPLRAEGLALRGYLKVFAGDESRGLIELGQAVTHDRRSLVPFLLRGQAQAHLRRFPAALADFHAAVQLDGTDADARRLAALYYAAAAYNGPRNLHESKAAADKAVDLSRRKDWLSLLALAAAEADAGDFRAAAGHAAEAADLTFDTNGRRCRELAKQFDAGNPLRLDWTPDGK